MASLIAQALTSGRRRPEAYSSHDVVGQGMQHADRFDLEGASDVELLQALATEVGVDALMFTSSSHPACRAGCSIADHAAAPAGDLGRIAVARLGRIVVGVAPGLEGTEYGDGLARQRRDVVEPGEAAVAEKALRAVAVTLLDLLGGRRQQSAIAAGRVDVEADDDAAVEVGRELHVVGGSSATLRHAHDAPPGVGGRATRRPLLFLCLVRWRSPATPRLSRGLPVRP